MNKWPNEDMLMNRWRNRWMGGKRGGGGGQTEKSEIGEQMAR